MTISSTFRQHWPEYLIEGTLLGLFMVSACGFTVLLEHSDSGAQPLNTAFLLVCKDFFRVTTHSKL